MYVNEGLSMCVCVRLCGGVCVGVCKGVSECVCVSTFTYMCG